MSDRRPIPASTIAQQLRAFCQIDAEGGHVRNCQCSCTALSMLPFIDEPLNGVIMHSLHALEQCIPCIRVISSQINGAHCVIDLRRSATKDPLPSKVLVPTLSKRSVILLANSAYHPTYKIRTNHSFLLLPEETCAGRMAFRTTKGHRVV